MCACGITNKSKCFGDTMNMVTVTGWSEMEVQKKVVYFAPSAFWLATEDMKDMGGCSQQNLVY